MKKIKALWWTTFGVINVYGIFLLMVYIIFMKTSGDPLNLILYQIFLSICGVLPVVIAVLAILNVKACLKYREELMAEPPVKMNLVMKFALIPFFIMNFLFWMIVGMYAILFWFRWSSWVVNIIFNIVTPFILFAEGLPALMAAILKGRKYYDDTYIKAAILHFFPLLEYLGGFYPLTSWKTIHGNKQHWRLLWTVWKLKKAKFSEQSLYFSWSLFLDAFDFFLLVLRMILQIKIEKSKNWPEICEEKETIHEKSY